METVSINRRYFLKSAVSLTGGLILAFYLPTKTRLAAAVESTIAMEINVNAWLQISPDDTITILVAHSEMGQGVYTSLPMLVAEELEADWSKIKVEMAAGVGGIYKNPLIGQQLTGGSTSIRSRWQSLRTVGAAARDMLIQAAAAQWQVKPEDCQALNSQVSHRSSGKTLSYGQLSVAAAKLSPPTNPQLKANSEFKLIGKPIKRLDLPAKVDGSAIFGIDVQIPKMLYAAVQQSPIFDGKIEAYDATAAESLKVIKLPPNGIAVVAESYWKAKQNLEALQVRFSQTIQPNLENTASIASLLTQGLIATGVVAHSSGEVAGALATAKQTLEVEYSVPFLAHVTMEPMNCTATVTKDECQIWVSTQAQERVQQVAIELTGLPKEKIKIHTTYLGGGFGRRAETDFVAQALTIAKALDQPVKVIWSREEDIQHDFYRPAMRIKMTAGLDTQGLPAVFSAHLIGPSIAKRFAPPMLKGGLDPFVMEGLDELGYDIPNRHNEYVMKDIPIPVGFWRSVAHTHNAFFVESFIDEMAHATDKDPYRFRQALLQKQPRFLKVLDTVAELGQWQKPAVAGHYRGMALHKSFGSIAGQVAEISISQAGELTVHKVVCVIDCGTVVNPDIVTAQVEGSIVMGLSALTEAITIKNGRVEQSNFDNYPVLRLSAMPAIEVYIIPSEESPGGVGEPATPPVIPAITNAIFAATGKRIRHLPVIPGKI